MNGFDAVVGTVPSDLGSSLRIALREERWFVVDLLGGVAGYVIWVAGTAALGLQVATLAEYQVAPASGPPTWPVLAILVLLWIGLPAIAGAAHLRGRVVNIRGNVDRVYRVDRPGVLLAAPVAFLLVLSVGTVLASGPLAPVLAVALVPATVYFLVRTLAYSYRVFAFSHPIAIQVATFLTLSVHASVGLAYLGLANGQRDLVQGVADRLGFGTVFADVDLAVTTAPYLVTMAVFVPVALGGAYLVLQRVAVFVVRRQDRPVSAASLRTGQRYPPWWEGDPAGITTSWGSRRRAAGGTDATGGTDAAGGPSATNGGVASQQGPTGESESTGSTSGTSTPSADGSADESDDGAGGGVDAGDGDDAGDSDVEPASHTRVYTPPIEELDEVPEPDEIRTGRNEDADRSNGGGNGGSGDASDVQASDSEGDSGISDAATDVVSDTTCGSCGTTVPGGTDAKFCPQCGEQIA